MSSTCQNHGKGILLTFLDLIEVSDPPGDAISAIRFSPHAGSGRLAVASWDKFVYVYELGADKRCSLVQKFEHRAPVLDVCFGKNNSEIFTACLDWDVRR